MTRIGDDVAGSLHHGRNVDVGSTAAPLTAVRRRLSRGVQLKAAAANSTAVYVGSSSVTAGTAAATDGFPLDPGDALFVPIDSPHKLYLIAASPQQSVCWLAI